jgi:tRNA A-37 threonylcarbamoyl transferase component Bud32
MTQPREFHKAPAPTPAVVTASAAHGLPPDILAEASRRLGWAALLYSSAYFLAMFGSMVASTGVVGVIEHWRGEHTFQMTVGAASIVFGLAVFAASRHARVSPERLLDFGLVFLVIGALGIAVPNTWGVFPEWQDSLLENYAGIPWECMWILVFPIIAPNTPGKTLIAALAAATASPAVLTLSVAAGASDAAVPLRTLYVYYVFSTYLCAVIAFLISRWVYGFGERLTKAREVGSYRLVAQLGEGGMGQVWRAEHRMLARPAAVKLIRPEALGADDQGRATMLRRFEREARATAALRSCHTIELYDFGATEGGAFYYVMELLEGLDLESLVARFGPVPSDRTVHLLRQACHSLGDAHENGMIHRDVKPANIYTCHLGPDFDFVKVLDFGLVKSTDRAEKSAAQLTAQGVTTGTPAYMAPEMAMAEDEIDRRADIYSLGCVAYWLVTGHRVFEGYKPMVTIVHHVKTPPVPPSQRTEVAIEPGLEETIMACLEKNPADRPQTAEELSRSLGALPDADAWSAKRARDWWELHMDFLFSAADGGVGWEPPDRSDR